MKVEANKIVMIRYKIPKCRLPEIIAWWQTVTVAPEERRIRVLSKGISLGLSFSIPRGGKTEPNSTLGEREE